ncbi:L10-interacting MYB domain-containing protein [Vitis vinifera]|uniref:L10-interacting MYB domain-containing protein n=1 Tax=Vitis vinifera TaxID=29760 RepID=A0A438HEN2_VITVI|nr:L10-interacting MYB domain-containing protein [Vitis vinifera]
MTTEITDVEDAGTWRGNIEKIFIDVMVNEVNKGNMDSGTFSTNTWRRILLEVNSQGKRNFNLKQLKQKFNRLRAMHREFSDLLKHTGFGWDAETNTVHALEETWQNYIRAHPNAKRFRSKGCPNYNLLGLIFNPSTATGALHYSSTQDPPNTDDEDEMDDNLEHGGVHVDVDTEIPDDPPQPEMAGGVTTRSGKRVTDSLLERKGKKESRLSQMGDALKAWVEASKARTETSRARTEALLARVDRYKSGTSSEATSGVTNDDNNTSSGELYDSTSSSEEGDDLDEIFIAHIMNEYEEIFLCKTSQRTSMLSGAQFDTRFVTVEEAVAMFLLIVGHNVRMRVVADRFQHSTETVARHFKEDCIGAIDGTHISAWVPADRQTSFRGTANDARVFLDALTRPEVNFPWPSEGKYYVVDSGYPCISGFLPPYRGERYHLQEYRGRHNQPIREYEVEDLSIEGEEESTSSRNHSIDLSDESAAAMAACRDQIAEVMWANYINVNP